MQQQAATNDALAQLTATAEHAMHNAAENATRQQDNANPIATAAAATVLNAAENATLQQGTAADVADFETNRSADFRNVQDAKHDATAAAAAGENANHPMQKQGTAADAADCKTNSTSGEGSLSLPDAERIGSNRLWDACNFCFA